MKKWKEEESVILYNFDCPLLLSISIHFHMYPLCYSSPINETRYSQSYSESPQNSTKKVILFCPCDNHCICNNQTKPNISIPLRKPMILGPSQGQVSFASGLGLVIQVRMRLNCVEYRPHHSIRLPPPLQLDRRR